MPRELNAKRNIAEIQDSRCADIHEIYYRSPTKSELAAFQATAFKRKGKTVTNKLYSNRIEYGQKIITGFKKGTFAFDGVLISCEKNDEGYKENWLDILATYTPEIVAEVGRQAFEGVSAAQDDLEMVVETDKSTDKSKDSKDPLSLKQSSTSQEKSTDF